MRVIRKITVILAKFIATVILSALLAVCVTSISPVYKFEEPAPFQGPDIFNPYSCPDSAYCWKRANFHTHTRVKGIMNECEYWPGEVLEAYRKFGYEIVTFSNHNELTEHPSDKELQVNVYEHGYNLFKYHKLVFGAEKENRFDHLIPLFTFQRQFQLDYLGKDSDFIQFNHPLRTNCTSKKMMERLTGYQIMELDSGKSTENEYWDWALSAGNYSFALANDDLHYPDRSNKIAVRCNFLCCPSGRYEDLKETLLGGCYYSMRIPDYGNGDWETKNERNRNLPYIMDIGLKDSTIYISLSEQADSIKVTGQNHKTLCKETNTDGLIYAMKTDDPYARFTVYFPEGEVIWSNPFARYDAGTSDSPLRIREHSVNIPLTIAFNLILMALCAGIGALIYRIYRK